MPDMHFSVVVEVQLLVEQCTLEIRAEGLRSAPAKFKPSTESIAPPAFARLKGAVFELTGALKENVGAGEVPMTVAIVRPENRPDPDGNIMPGITLVSDTKYGAAHFRYVLVNHDEVAQIVLPRIIDPDKSAGAKLNPNTDSVNAPLGGALTSANCNMDGASNVYSVVALVPKSIATVMAVLVESRTLTFPTQHLRRVELVQDVLAQLASLKRAECVKSYTENESPTTESVLSPRRGPFVPMVAETTGASHESTGAPTVACVVRAHVCVRACVRACNKSENHEATHAQI